MSTHKEIYEALQAVNAYLDPTGEQLLVDLVEKVRTGLRRETEREEQPGTVESTLKIWIAVDAAEPTEDMPTQGAWGALKPGSLEAKAAKYPGLRLV